MNTLIEKYILSQPAERQNILEKIHQTIIESDKTVEATIEKMMGKEMILYKNKGSMKYGLASVKSYMSLHALPIYVSPALNSKYQLLLSNAKFQKGCINFENENEMPIEIVKDLITDCSKIDLAKIREEQLKAAKAKKNAKK